MTSKLYFYLTKFFPYLHEDALFQLIQEVVKITFKDKRNEAKETHRMEHSLDSENNIKTVIVTGATGKTGSRVIEHLQKQAKNEKELRIIALVRNATKAEILFGKTNENENRKDTNPYELTIVEADYSDPIALQSALSPYKNNSLRIFLSCSNGPDQVNLELNVVRAVSEGTKCFCVKLSTSQPFIEKGVHVGKVHLEIEEELERLLGGDNCVMLRPNLFFQMMDPSLSGALLGVNTRLSTTTYDEKESQCHHMFADAPISMIDVDDVAACAASILSEENPSQHHGKQIYELTGPEAITLSNQFAKSVSTLLPSPFTIQSQSLEDQLLAANIPLSSKDQLEPFLTTLQSYHKVTDTVPNLIGRPAKSIQEYIFRHPKPFLPSTFRRLVGNKNTSFRKGAKPCTVHMDEEIKLLEADEMLVRVQAAGVNGGAATIGIVNALENVTDFLLGTEGAGRVLLCGSNVTQYQPGDTVSFVARGTFGEYVRVKEARCANLPSHYNHEEDGSQDEKRIANPCELSALRISALTALVALQRTCPIQSTDVVLVTACCGGTGHFAVQIAKAAGATVIGTVGSTAKVHHAQSLGVIDRVVDLSKENLGHVLQTEFPKGINVVYEGVGGSLLKDAYMNLAEGGRILIVGSISQYPHNDPTQVPSHDIEGLGDIMKLFRSGETVELDDHGRTIIGNVWGDTFSNRPALTEYTSLVYHLHSKGQLNVLLDSDKLFVGVDSICDAVDHMMSRKSIGKVCVKMSH